MIYPTQWLAAKTSPKTPSFAMHLHIWDAIKCRAFQPETQRVLPRPPGPRNENKRTLNFQNVHILRNRSFWNRWHRPLWHTSLWGMCVIAWEISFIISRIVRNPVHAFSRIVFIFPFSTFSPIVLPSSLEYLFPGLIGSLIIICGRDGWGGLSVKLLYPLMRISVRHG